MKKLNKKGFSLVELIIVIAIMAVLIGVLAPTYLGQVAKANKSTDLQNAQEIATSIAVKAAQSDALTVTTTKTAITWGTSGVSDIAAAPAIKANSAYTTWYYEFDGANVKVGVAKASLADPVQLYPTVDSPSTWAN